MASGIEETFIRKPILFSTAFCDPTVSIPTLWKLEPTFDRLWVCLTGILQRQVTHRSTNSSPERKMHCLSTDQHPPVSLAHDRIMERTKADFKLSSQTQHGYRNCSPSPERLEALIDRHQTTSRKCGRTSMRPRLMSKCLPLMPPNCT